MQVNLLSVSGAALAGSRIGDLLPAVPGSSPVLPLRGEEDQLRARVRRDEEKEAAATATLVPSRPAEVIAEAERKIERTSRAFRRGVARDGAAERFRQDREAFRQALADAKGRGPQRVPRSTAHTTSPDAAKPQAKPGAAVQVDAANKEPSATVSDSAKATTARGSSRSSSGQAAVPPTMTGRASSSAGGAAGPSAGDAAVSNALRARAVGASVTQAGSASGRVAPSTAAHAGNTAGSGTAKASGGASAVVLSARGPVRPGVVARAKAGAARPAGNAAWDANIERILRVVRNRISGERSRTVLRLDPPELGRLRLQMDLRSDVLTLRIDSSTELAHRLLLEDVERLRQGLEASGIRLEQVEVRPPPGPDANEHRTSQQAETQHESQGGSAETDVEHPAEHGTDSHPTEAVESATGGADPEPATESLVDVVA